ncbi:TIGR02281 family clan AA aspartic protease [Seohaeicola saemankumensis]|nr:TIGR02281 family clan AA aspartic protease [Seohaeicola saemankumensis]MCA0870050.1 TIGR02281 family clan AA aspartic protease [Seohaeicola saemankumensis]
MDGDSWGRLIYLALLGSVIAFWFFVQNRQTLGKTLQQAMAWVLIFIGVIAVVGLWDDIRTTVRPSLGTVTDSGAIEVPRARDGHFYLTLRINGTPIEFMVDTGASQMVLSEGDAKRAGIDTGDLAFVGRAMTANGEVRTAPVRLDSVALGPVEERDFYAAVNGGDMGVSLLGMSYLQRWERIEITGRALVLER